jgi:hypothetical protein
MKKLILAVITLVLMGISATKLAKANEDGKVCCPKQGTTECNPPEVCCCE